MTQRLPPVLDRILYVVTETTSPGPDVPGTPGDSYEYDTNRRETGVGSFGVAGGWGVAINPGQTMSELTEFSFAEGATAVLLAASDADGDMLPDPLTAPFSLLWTAPNGQTMRADVATVEGGHTDAQTGNRVGVKLNLEGTPTLTGNLTMGAGAGRQVFALGATSATPGDPVTVETRTPIWAARRDYSTRDAFQRLSDSVSVIAITDSRFIVRAESRAWALNDEFEDDDGNERRVTNISQIGRGFLELVGRKLG